MCSIIAIASYYYGKQASQTAHPYERLQRADSPNEYDYDAEITQIKNQLETERAKQR